MPIQKKKQSLFSKLGAKLRTPKGRLIATILIFGAIGGGILVYKSFAATPPSQSWNYSKGAGNADFTVWSPSKCSAKYVAEPQKNNMLVANVYCPANETNKVIVYTKGSYLPASYIGSNIRACAYIKGLIGYALVDINLLDQNVWDNRYGDWDRARYFQNINSSTYGYYCTSYISLNVASRINMAVEVNGIGAKTSFLNVGTIVLEKQ